MAYTVKKIILKGDKKSPESATHIIEFPGGSVELSRTSDNEYWVHISVSEGAPEIGNTLDSKVGFIRRIRKDVNVDGKNYHFAVRVGTEQKKVDKA